MRGRGIDLAQIQAPCKGCADRQLHCHSSCEKYIAFEKESKDLRQKRLKAMESKWAAAEGEARRFKNFGTSKSSIRYGKGMRGA